MGPNFPTYWWTMGRTLVKCLEVRLEKLNKRYFNYFQTFSSFQDPPCLEHHNMRSCRQKTKVFSESVNYLKFGLDGWVMGSVFQDGGHLFLVLNSYKWREKRYIRLFLLLCCLLCLASWSHFVSWHCFFFFFFRQALIYLKWTANSLCCWEWMTANFWSPRLYFPMAGIKVSWTSPLSTESHPQANKFLPSTL